MCGSHHFKTHQIDGPFFASFLWKPKRVQQLAMAKCFVSNALEMAITSVDQHGIPHWTACLLIALHPSLRKRSHLNLFHCRPSQNSGIETFVKKKFEENTKLIEEKFLILLFWVKVSEFRAE